jgi:hypothetical protein
MGQAQKNNSAMLRRVENMNKQGLVLAVALALSSLSPAALSQDRAPGTGNLPPYNPPPYHTPQVNPPAYNPPPYNPAQANPQRGQATPGQTRRRPDPPQVSPPQANPPPATEPQSDKHSAPPQKPLTDSVLGKLKVFPSF